MNDYDGMTEYEFTEELARRIELLPPSQRHSGGERVASIDGPHDKRGCGWWADRDDLYYALTDGLKA